MCFLATANTENNIRSYGALVDLLISITLKSFLFLAFGWLKNTFFMVKLLFRNCRKTPFEEVT